MNFVVSSTTLLKQLQTISGVLTTNSTLPILDNFLFEINKQSLRVSASDIETTMKTEFEVESSEAGKICIPAKLLLEILKNLPDQPLTFTINDDNFGIEISYSNGKSKMVGYNGNDFPEIKEVKQKDVISMPGNMLAEAINKTIFAAGNDDLRPVMSGVFCQFTSDEMTFVATDAHKLVRFRKPLASSVNIDFILPKKALNILKNNLTSGEGTEVKITYNEYNAVFSFQNIELTCRLIDGKYPNYEAVIPKENPNVLTIDRAEFYNSLKRVSIFSNKTTHQVSLKISGAELAISAEDIDFANEAKERLTCNYAGEDIEIGFNSRFLIEMLGNLDSDEIQLMMSQPNRAGLIVPINDKTSEGNILMLVMPVMINN
ncbi:MAG: DNA polymerase III subunit beta [Brumimicrobium sp.]|nr:DNA polymerase III subunit beta [Brumimicrobium sp.]MCO5268173.1 DNA polymerase III subunit beta [Brumimicrobium sp.]